MQAEQKDQDNKQWYNSEEWSKGFSAGRKYKLFKIKLIQVQEWQNKWLREFLHKIQLVLKKVLPLLNIITTHKKGNAGHKILWNKKICSKSMI